MTKKERQLLKGEMEGTGIYSQFVCGYGVVATYSEDTVSALS